MPGFGAGQELPGGYREYMHGSRRDQIRMSEGSNEPQQPVCGACGRPHLPTRWEREYLCPSCGKPLHARSAGAGRRGIPLVAIVGVGAVLIMGGGLRLAADHLSRQPRTTPLPVMRPVAEARPQVVLPPDFEAKLIQKLDLLREDLRAEPANPGLLQRLAETHLLHAMYYRETGKPDYGQGSLQRARRVASRLATVDPQMAQDLLYQCNNFDRLEWGEPRPVGNLGERGPLGGPAAGNWNSRYAPDGEPTRLEPGRGPGFSENPFPRLQTAPVPSTFPDGPGFRPVPPGGGSGSTPYPRPLEVVPGRGLALRTEPFPADAQGLPGVPPPPGPSVSDAERGRLLSQLQFRTELVKSTPTAIGPVLDLINLHETLAAVERRLSATQGGLLGEAEEKWLRRALEVCMTAAARNPLRTHRATLYDRAADLHGRLREWDQQYQVLRKALDAVPTSPRLWRRLQSACLLTGRREENLEAREQYKDWSFPTLVFRDL